ncbi:MAG TPA: ribosome rescue GTPase HflX [Gammaproteobacteria bacterium]|nr:ribosome rescue GTPase HflX [Gammaproteobacteria bacterium]
MFDRPRTGERALLPHVGLQRPCDQDEIEEFRALAGSAGADIVGELAVRLQRPNPRLLIGLGKAKETAERITASGAELLLVSRPLTPSQERNLEAELKVRVLDRNGLILDIFAQRAMTFEGKIQVELAQLEHLATRLVRGWTHLERQKGGIGLRGPGETQLESDRRMLGQRIRHLRGRLIKVERQRDVSRRDRRRSEIPTVALVGYTNAGKTSLFNALSGARSPARNLLFATLDPAIRRLDCGTRDEILVADTVGFVRDLPHELVAAFKATLTETREARLLLHVIDASDPHHADRRDQVEEVLDSIGAGHVPRIQVYNKVDKCRGELAEEFATVNGTQRLRVSAVTGEGVSALAAAICAACVGARVARRIELSPGQSRLRARLFDLRAVTAERANATGGWTLDVELSSRRWQQLCAQEGLADDGVLRKM